MLSYKNYLIHLEEEDRKSPFFRFSLFLATFLFIVVGILLVLFYIDKKEEPIRTQVQYINDISSGFIPIEQSLDEILATFKIAGEKTQIINNLQDSQNPSEGFYVYLDDLQKTQSKISLTKTNVINKKKLLEDLETPQGFEGLNTKLLTFYADSIEVLQETENNFSFAKEILLVLGPSLYLPTLSNENLWQENNEDKIISYYNNLKNEASLSLGELRNISPPEDFKTQYDLQTAHLELLETSSQEIIDTLSEENSKDSDTATQIEKAYQILTNARKENLEVAEGISLEKLRLVSVKENLNKFAHIEIQKNSIKENIETYISQTQPPKNIKFKIPKFSLDGII